MKYIGKALIIAGALSFCGCVCLGLGTGMLYKEQKNGTSRNNSEYEEKQYSTMANGISTIQTDILWDDVVIEPGEGDDIEIVYQDRIDEPRYQISENNGVLQIAQKPSKRFLFFDIPDLRFGWTDEETISMTIYVPESYAGDYDLNLSSGSLTVQDLEMKEKLKVYATSGIIKLDNLTCEKDVEVEITSGSVTIENAETKGNMSCRFTSGHIGVQELTVKGDMIVDGSSGSINMTDVDVDGALECELTSGRILSETISAESVSASTSSGMIVLDELTVEKGVECFVTSGTVRVTLTDDISNYRINSDVTSGRCSLPGNFGNGDKYIDVEVTSGNVDFFFGE
ncbi:MAG: DUF4097 domain-containing protein [Bacteroides sp.]|nr:DUF4097 domain-containing protein [Bacteroides sp.]MCM1548764.1 DUF4097 domain-containing protein [Clostridium sp.]